MVSFAGIAQDASAAADINPLAVTLGAVGVMLLLLVMVTMMRRRGVNRPAAGDQGQAARDEIDRIRADVTGSAPKEGPREGNADASGVRLASRLAAQLDGKAARLELLIEEALAAAERLERAVAAADAAGAEKAPVDAPVVAAGERQAEVPEDPLFTRIFRLADQGLAAVDIARHVREPTGKVELVLSLREASRPQ